MSKNKKRPAVGSSRPGPGTENATNYPHCTSPDPSRQAQLETFDRAMVAAGLAGDDDAWVSAFQAWLAVFCGGSDV